MIRNIRSWSKLDPKFKSCTLSNGQYPSEMKKLIFLKATKKETTNDYVMALKSAVIERSLPSDEIKKSIAEISMVDWKVKCAQVKGKWELVYSTLIPGSGYFPVVEICDFYGYSLTSSWGPISIGGSSGDSVILSETNPAMIQFNNKRRDLGPFSFDVKPKNRTYTFLYVDSEIAIGLSSSGGTTLLKRVE